MSGGTACRCSTRDVRVINRRCNYSAFNSYHRTPSAYSQVVCLSCGAIWRTKADYVDSSPDAPPDWGDRAVKARQDRDNSSLNLKSH